MTEEFSYLIKAGKIKDQPVEYHLKADPDQCAALALRFGLVSLAYLDGAFWLRHDRGGVITARLTLRAKVTQTCVVTLEPFEDEVTEETEVRFVPAALLQRQPATPEEEGEEDITPESLESPDEIPYENDQIDLGAALAEQLALSLPPYPRKPGAALPDAALDDSANPFAALAARLDKKSDKSS